MANAVILNGVGHVPMAERHRQLDQIVEGFLGQAPAHRAKASGGARRWIKNLAIRPKTTRARNRLAEGAQ